MPYSRDVVILDYGIQFLAQRCTEVLKPVDTPRTNVRLTALAKVWLGLGAVDEAREAAGRALAMHREFGCRPGEQQALAVLERCVKVD